jgi:hypothetical protein
VKAIYIDANLADFDPRVRRTDDDTDDSHEITFQRADAEMKTHQTIEHGDGRKTEGWSAEENMFLDSKESADRFSHALSHAITLCGGKTAPF